MNVEPLGDSALLLRVCEDFERDPEECLQRVSAAAQCLKAAAIPWLVEVTPAYATIGLFLDLPRALGAGAPPDKVADWVKEKIVRIVADCRAPDSEEQARELLIPVCYDVEFALDAEYVAKHTGLAFDEIVRLHAAAEYRVHCVGFAPGFPYLGGLPKELATPRRSEPRKQVPAGSVAIGGSQTGIYPAASPGGWNVIGRTSITFFSLASDSPALLRAGDRVRFRPVSRSEFQASAR